jgi:hypothetical protein
MGIGKNVFIVNKFIPFDQLKWYYGCADMTIHMVQPSQLAASGSMRTDLSHGVPVIAIQSNMTFDLSRTVLKVGGTAEMITRLVQLSKDDDKLKVMRCQAESFTKRHTWGEIAVKHLAVYSKLVGKTFAEQSLGVRLALFHSSPWVLGSLR